VRAHDPQTQRGIGVSLIRWAVSFNEKEDFFHFTDTEIVEYFRDASVRRAQCGFNVTPANRIIDHEMGPAYEALAARGPAHCGNSCR
jgi:hypothetical protein